MGVGLTSWRVAFFRNLNLGQARSHSPTSGQLLAAFAAAGAGTAMNVQTNGTVIFRHTGGTPLAREVVRLLGPVCGYADAVVVRSARWCLELDQRLTRLDAGEVRLFDGRADLGLPLPWEGPDGLVLVALDRRHAVTQAMPGREPKNANPVVTGLVGVPVTVRGIPTMRRLAVRLRGLGGS